jgi:ferrous iron transport protein A
MTLDELPRGGSATISAIDWIPLDVREQRRLRELGFEEGARVSVAHRGILLWADPIAVTIGRMTVAIRRAHAAVMTVEPAAA